MKITVKKSVVVTKSINYDDITPGMVFEYKNGVLALKLDYGESILLKYSSGDEWFTVSDGSIEKHNFIKRILGRLTEIIVQEE